MFLCLFSLSPVSLEHIKLKVGLKNRSALADPKRHQSCKDHCSREFDPKRSLEKLLVPKKQRVPGRTCTTESEKRSYHNNTEQAVQKKNDNIQKKYLSSA